MLGRGHRQVSDGVALGPGDELMSFGEQLSDEPAAGVVGIGHEQNFAIQQIGVGEHQHCQLIEQGSGIAVGEDQPFVNPRHQWYGGHLSGSALDQQRNGLKRMAHDVFRLGIAGRLLMQALDGGHQLALLGRLDAVGQADQAGARSDRREQCQAQFHPAGGELVQIESLAVKQMQEAVVGLGAKAENPDIAGNPGQIQPATEANEGQQHPQESA